MGTLKERLAQRVGKKHYYFTTGHKLSMRQLQGRAAMIYLSFVLFL